MKIGFRIALALLISVGAGVYLLLDWIVEDLTPRYRESTEEALVDFANTLAELVATQTEKGRINAKILHRTFDKVSARDPAAKIYAFEKHSIDLRVYITDRQGIVVFDSDNGRDEGKDYSHWRDVSQTLQGTYGARTSRDDPAHPGSILYIAAPIKVENDLIGVLTVAKPTTNANQLIESAKIKITRLGIVITLLMVGCMVGALFYIIRPIKNLTRYAQEIRDGKRASLPALPRDEIGTLGRAFEEMRVSLEGKRYVERYVQTVTHEIKSPLSGIKGAAELLHEELTPEMREKFLGNIERETARLQQLADRLLELSTVQNRSDLSIEKISLTPFIEEIFADMRTAFEAKNVRCSFKGAGEIEISADRFWIRQAIVNLLQNALDFAPPDSEVLMSAVRKEHGIAITVEDSGPGVPAWASPRIFEQFFSLARPDSGRRSTGLGLSLVKEVVERHGGDVLYENRDPRGAKFTMTL